MSEKYLCILAALMVTTYAVYMTFTPDPADGLLMSAVIGAIAAVGGIHIGRGKAI